MINESPNRVLLPARRSMITHRLVGDVCLLLQTSGNHEGQADTDFSKYICQSKH